MMNLDFLVLYESEGYNPLSRGENQVLVYLNDRACIVKILLILKCLEAGDFSL